MIYTTELSRYKTSTERSFVLPWSPPPQHHHHITEERLATVGTLLHSRKEKAIKTESYPRRDKTPVNRDSIHAAKRPPVWRNSCPRLSALPSPLGGFRIHSPCAGSETRLPVETRPFYLDPDLHTSRGFHGLYWGEPTRPGSLRQQTTIMTSAF